MTTLLLTHSACLDHATPPGHPERADRLRAVAEVLGQEHFKALNAELAKAWKMINERKPAPPDADEWKDVEKKLHLLDRGGV